MILKVYLPSICYLRAQYASHGIFKMVETWDSQACDAKKLEGDQKGITQCKR